MLLAGLAWDEAESSEEPSLIHLERPSMEVGSSIDLNLEECKWDSTRHHRARATNCWEVSCKSCP